MNYIQLINRFWASSEINSFRTTDIALYFYLLKVNNDCSWIESFRRNNRKIEVDLDISFNTLKDARNRLKIAGLIDFKTRNGDGNVLYTLSKFDKVSDEVSDEVADEVGSRLLTSKYKDKGKDKEKDKILSSSLADVPHPPKMSFTDFLKLAEQNISGDRYAAVAALWDGMTYELQQKAIAYQTEYKVLRPDKKDRMKIADFLLKQEYLNTPEPKPLVVLRYLNIEFEAFWLVYGKKDEKKEAVSEWHKLTDDERVKAMEHAPKYCAGREVKYQKAAHRYLKGKIFNDEITYQGQNNGKSANGYGQAKSNPSYGTKEEHAEYARKWANKFAAAHKNH